MREERNKLRRIAPSRSTGLRAAPMAAPRRSCTQRLPSVATHPPGPGPARRPPARRRAPPARNGSDAAENGRGSGAAGPAGATQAARAEEGAAAAAGPGVAGSGRPRPPNSAVPTRRLLGAGLVALSR